MNLLEHYIVEIHSIKDVTNNFIERCGYIPQEELFEVDITYNCYGVIERKKMTFWKTDWESVKQAGYFMA